MVSETAVAEAMTLPTMVISPVDVNRLQRELEALEAFLQQAKIRHPGEVVKLPSTSRLFEELARSNHLNLLKATDRQRAATFLKDIKTNSPVLHISFATDPSAAFLKQLIIWLRNNIHPQVLVRVGLQPTIAAGCTIRTSNKVFDFSLRQRFLQRRHLLVEALKTNGALPNNQ